MKIGRGLGAGVVCSELLTLWQQWVEETHSTAEASCLGPWSFGSCLGSSVLTTPAPMGWARPFRFQLQFERQYYLL